MPSKTPSRGGTTPLRALRAMARPIRPRTFRGRRVPRNARPLSRRESRAALPEAGGEFGGKVDPHNVLARDEPAAAMTLRGRRVPRNARPLSRRESRAALPEAGGEFGGKVDPYNVLARDDSAAAMTLRGRRVPHDLSPYESWGERVPRNEAASSRDDAAPGRGTNARTSRGTRVPPNAIATACSYARVSRCSDSPWRRVARGRLLR